MIRVNWNGLIQRQDPEPLAIFATACLGVSVPPLDFLWECQKARKPRDDRDWSQCTWRMWLKNRADRVGAYRVGCMDTSLEKFPTGVLHIGFAFLEETEEHLSRLRREEVFFKETSPTRSRISHQLIDINPIDRVAIRVAPKNFSK